MKTPWCLLFPGQGSQSIGMGADLVRQFPEVARTFEEASDALNFDVQKLCFEGSEEALALTENCQPAILTVSIGAWRALSSRIEINADWAIGHSLGEYSALVVAEAMSFSEAVKAVRERGKLMQQAVAVGIGGMLALLGGEKESAYKLADESSSADNRCWPANFNGPGQIVLSGHLKALETASKRSKDFGFRRAVFLNVSTPFHCPLMKPAADGLADALRLVHFDHPIFKVIHNVTGLPSNESSDIYSLLIRQVTSPVLFDQCVSYAASEGAACFLEVGPGNVLSGLVKRISASDVILNFSQVDDLNVVMEMMN